MSKEAFDLMRVRIYLSGTVKDKGAIGGFSALMVAGSGDMQIRRTLSGHGVMTSVTRMQLKAVESALMSIKARQDKKLEKDPDTKLVLPILEFYTTNAQVSSGLNKNVYTWAKKDWKTLKNETLQHADLWQNIYYLLEHHTMSHRVILQKTIDSSEELFSTVRHSLFVAENNSGYAMNKSVFVDEEAVINGNVSK